MNGDKFKGQWKQLKGEVQKQWGKLSDDDYHKIQGDKEKLIGKIQERHGQTREQAEQEYNNWYRSL
jgi:uncharacterized protein YjbJ (UPF0337 family)